MPEDKELLVDCGAHGKRVSAIVCRHLLTEKQRTLGFVENSSDPKDLQAWCDDCEEMFVREGELTEAFQAFCDMAIVCVVCYDTIKKLHTHVIH